MTASAATLSDTDHPAAKQTSASAAKSARLDRWPMRILATLGYLVAVGALVAVAGTGTEADPPEPITIAAEPGVSVID